MIELLVSSLIAMMAMGTIGFVFIGVQKHATERGKQLLLVQSLSSTLLQIKEDIQRAGFNGVRATPATLSGASSTVYMESAPGLVGYAYQISPSGASSYRNVVFKREESGSPSMGDGLKICEKHSSEPLSVSSASKSVVGGKCYNLFNPSQISITNFSVNDLAVKGEGAETQMVTLLLKGHLVADSDVSYQADITTLVRNWR